MKHSARKRIVTHKIVIWLYRTNTPCTVSAQLYMEYSPVKSVKFLTAQRHQNVYICVCVCVVNALYSDIRKGKITLTLPYRRYWPYRHETCSLLLVRTRTSKAYKYVVYLVDRVYIIFPVYYFTYTKWKYMVVWCPV
jgi:hypothetical protein